MKNFIIEIYEPEEAFWKTLKYNAECDEEADKEAAVEAFRAYADCDDESRDDFMLNYVLNEVRYFKPISDNMRGVLRDMGIDDGWYFIHKEG